MAISPMAAPPTKVPHLPVPSRSSQENSNAHSNLLTIIGICVGILIVIFVVIIIICACSHCKSNELLAGDVETCKFPLTSLFPLSIWQFVPIQDPSVASPLLMPDQICS